ncbi:BON domain-containing protein, partial [bacterium]|nr:BON domain-containing protein [bacterium]
MPRWRSGGGSVAESGHKTACLICSLLVGLLPQISPAGAEVPDSSGESESSFLARSVQAELAGDRWVRVRGLRVEERDGELTLRGSVPTADAARFVERNVRHKAGVRRVINLLQVENDSSALAGGVLQSRVDSALGADPYLPRVEGVAATVDGEAVLLTGSVRDAFERKQAERVALGVAGVGAVRNRIVVRENVLRQGDSGAGPGFDCPELTAALDSLCPSSGINPDLAINLDAATLTYWRESINTDSVRAALSFE